MKITFFLMAQLTNDGGVLLCIIKLGSRAPIDISSGNTSSSSMFFDLFSGMNDSALEGERGDGTELEWRMEGVFENTVR